MPCLLLSPVGNALLACFVVASLNGYAELMEACMSAPATKGSQPHLNANPAAFFWCVQCVGSGPGKPEQHVAAGRGGAGHLRNLSVGSYCALEHPIYTQQPSLGEVLESRESFLIGRSHVPSCPLLYVLFVPCIGCMTLPLSLPFLSHSVPGLWASPLWCPPAACHSPALLRMFIAPVLYDTRCAATTFPRFVGFAVVVSFTLLNLYVGVIFSQFSKIRNMSTTGSAFLTNKQQVRTMQQVHSHKVLS